MSNLIYLSDARTFPWPEADVMLADPPYSEAVHRKAISQSRGGGTRTRDLGFEHLSDECRAWTCAQAAKVKRWSLIYSDIESVGLWKNGLEQAGATYIRAIPWVRWSMPQLSGDRPPSGCEMLIVAYGSSKGKKRWNGPGNLTHLSHKCMRGALKHKAQKPLEQALDLVKWFSDPGETVISPFGGHGTDTLACRTLGRISVSTEMDPVWFDRIAARLNNQSEDDGKRIAAWLASQVDADADLSRMRANTAKIRDKLNATG